MSAWPSFDDVGMSGCYLNTTMYVKLGAQKSSTPHSVPIASLNPANCIPTAANSRSALTDAAPKENYADSHRYVVHGPSSSEAKPGRANGQGSKYEVDQSDVNVHEVNSCSTGWENSDVIVWSVNLRVQPTVFFRRRLCAPTHFTRQTVNVMNHSLYNGTGINERILEDVDTWYIRDAV